VGYGASASRYHEEKRVVLHKDIGPLVSAEEMSRCINCTVVCALALKIGGVMETGPGLPRRACGDHEFCLRHGGLRTVRQHDRLCARSRAHQQTLPLQCAHLGVVATQIQSARTTAWGQIFAGAGKNNRVMRVLPLENEAVKRVQIRN